MRRWLIVMCFLCCAVHAPTMLLAGEKKAGQKKAKDKTTCELVTDLRKTGLIMDVREEGFAIDVNRTWYNIPMSQKQATAAAMLECLNPGRNHIKIFDGYSGKQIGRYGKAWGYSSYE